MSDPPVAEPTLREPAARVPEPAPTQREGAATPAPSLLRLPAILAERYRIRRHLPTQGAEADLLLVEPQDEGLPVVVKLYRPGLKPNTAVLARLSESHPEAVVRLLDHGEAEGIWYEVMEWAAQGSLRDWLAAGPLTPAQAREVLVQAHNALEALHAQHILHRDLKPENLLVRQREPLHLALSDFGIASLTAATLHFTSAHRTLRYAAPEASAGAVSPASDYWSLGMILAEALTGRHPYEGLSDRAIPYELATRSVPLIGLPEPWLNLCRGLLLRDPQRRWGGKEVDRWLCGDSSLPTASEEMPAPTDQRQANRPYRLGGQDCWTAAQLAARLAERWADGVKDLQRGLLTPWLRDELHDQDAVRLVMDLLDDRDLSPDGRLLRLLLHLDPGLSPVWKGRRLDDLDLALLARQAMAQGAEQRDLIAELWTERVVEAAAQAGRTAYRDIHTAWAAAISEYEQAWARVIQAGAPATLRPDVREALPGLLLAALDPAFAAGLLKEWRAGQPRWKSVSACSWFPSIARKLQAKSAGQVLVALRLGSEADRQALEPWRQLTAELNALEQQALADSLARTRLRELRARLGHSPLYHDIDEVNAELDKVHMWAVNEKALQSRAIVIDTFNGHRGSVLSVAFSPYGRYALSGGSDYTLKLWDTTTGQGKRTFTGHTDSVNSVAFSPDGRHALSGSADSTLKLWDIATGQNVRTFTGHSSYSYLPTQARQYVSIAGKVNCVCFLSGGKKAASGSDDNTIKLWDVGAGKELLSVSIRGNRIIALAAAPDGRTVLSISTEVFIPPKRRQWEVENSGLRIWDIEGGRPVYNFAKQWPSHKSLAISSDGRYALTGNMEYDILGIENCLTLWDVATRQEVRTFKGHADDVNSVDFSPDGCYGLSGSDDKTLKLWDIATGKELCTLTGHLDSVNSVAFSPDGYYALSGSSDGTLKLWALWHVAPSQRSFSLRELIPWERENARAIAPLQAPEQLASLKRDFADLIASNTLFAERVATISKSLVLLDRESCFNCIQTISALRTAAEIFCDYEKLETELEPLLSRSRGLRLEFGALKTQLRTDQNLNQPEVGEQIRILRKHGEVYAEAFTDYDRLQEILKPLLGRSEYLRRESVAIDSLLQDFEKLPAAGQRMVGLRQQAKVHADTFAEYDRLQSALKPLGPRSEWLRREAAAIDPLLQDQETLPQARERVAILRDATLTQAEAARAFDALKSKYGSFASPEGDFARDCVEIEDWLCGEHSPEAILERIAQVRQQAAKLWVAHREYESLRNDFSPLFAHTGVLKSKMGEVARLLSTHRYDEAVAAFGLILELRDQAVALQESLRDEHFAAAVAEEERQDRRWLWWRNYREAKRRYGIAESLGHPQAAERLAGLHKKLA